jgi:UDP-N-acetylglucosamine 2-epimerase (non-hydrolysing)
VKKILIVFGTRPEAIKMAPVVKALKLPHLETRVCITAQHRDMLDQILDIFDIEADYDLNLMRPGQNLYDITTGVLTGLRDVLTDFRPDVALVHGDTTTSMATALACFYEQIPVAHVEAGLRTYDLQAPWPEEANRQITARLTQYHFAPTQTSAANLKSENIPEDRIVITGNTVIDALLMMRQKIDADGALAEGLTQKITTFGYDIQRDRKRVLITAHRRENFGDGFQNLCEAIRDLADRFSNVDFIYPVHLNPNVRAPVQKILSDRDNVFLIEPLDYACFVMMLDRAHIVLTDSGGIQEEAPSFGKPVLVMRRTTERPEAVEAGTVRLVGTDKTKIFDEVSRLLNDAAAYKDMSRAHNPYGDGKAAQRIREFLEKTL